MKQIYIIPTTNATILTACEQLLGTSNGKPDLQIDNSGNNSVDAADVEAKTYYPTPEWDIDWNE